MRLKNICEVQYKDPDTLQNRTQSTGSRWVGSINDLVHGSGQSAQKVNDSTSKRPRPKSGSGRRKKAR